jgi:hypothetical protein
MNYQAGHTILGTDRVIPAVGEHVKVLYVVQFEVIEVLEHLGR